MTGENEGPERPTRVARPIGRRLFNLLVALWLIWGSLVYFIRTPLIIYGERRDQLDALGRRLLAALGLMGP